jgi:hypothetical protein
MHLAMSGYGDLHHPLPPIQGDEHASTQRNPSPRALNEEELGLVVGAEKIETRVVVTHYRNIDNPFVVAVWDAMMGPGAAAGFGPPSTTSYPLDTGPGWHC